MSNELKIGGKSFVVDDPKGNLERLTPDERKEEHREHTSSDTLVSVLRPEPKPQAPIRPSSFAPEDMVRSRVALYDGLVSGRAGLPGVFAMWLFGGIPAILVGREIWFLCIDHLPTFNEEPGRFLLILLGLIAGEGIPLAALLVLAISTLATFDRRKSSSQTGP
jgi:hypothetical protein